MKRLHLLLAFVLVSGQLFSQKEGQALADSLVDEIPYEKNDTTKAKMYNRLGNYYIQVNLDSALHYANKGLQLTTQMNWVKGIAAFHTIFGNIYVRKGDMENALKEHQKALSNSIKIKDTIGVAVSYNNLGTIANAKSDYVNAAKYYTYTLEIGKSQNNYYNTGVALENLSLVYQYQQDFIKQLEFARKSLAAFETIPDEKEYPGPLGLMANAFINLKNYDSAYYYYKKAIYAAQKVNDELKEGSLYNYLSQYYSEKKNYDSAIKTALKGKQIFDRIGPSFEDAIINKGLLGYYYLQFARSIKKGSAGITLKTAKKLLDEAVQEFKQAKNLNGQAEFQKSLAEANAVMGDYKNAYLNYKTYAELSDSIFSQENKNKLAAIASQKEIEKNQLEIEKQRINTLEQRKKALLSLFGLLLMTVAGVLFYRLSIVRKQKNEELKKLNRELDNANKVKVKFLGILSHDLRSPIANLVNFLNLRKIAPDALDKEQVEEKEEKIKASAESLLGTMENMLLWSKSQLEIFHPEIKTVKVNSLFLSLQKLFQQNKNIEFINKVDTNMEILTDENFLKTIMHNFTSNAINALAGRINGKIEWKGWQEDNKSFLSIQDNGPGISKEKLNVLFDENAGSDAHYGFGLHIIRDMAKAIHCNISVQSGEESGTAFVLAL